MTVRTQNIEMIVIATHLSLVLVLERETSKISCPNRLSLKLYDCGWLVSILFLLGFEYSSCKGNSICPWAICQRHRYYCLTTNLDDFSVRQCIRLIHNELQPRSKIVRFMLVLCLLSIVDSINNSLSCIWVEFFVCIEDRA